ncbi:MAG: WhiB family transcriptional regulator [Actinomycetota bacterium]
MAAGELFAFREWDDTTWSSLAECRGSSEIFFPPAAERPQAREKREAQAREVCHSCSVMFECRDFARRHREYGFWGGESEEERHAAGFRLIAPIGVRARQIS